MFAWFIHNNPFDGLVVRLYLDSFKPANHSRLGVHSLTARYIFAYGYGKPVGYRHNIPVRFDAYKIPAIQGSSFVVRTVRI